MKESRIKIIHRKSRTTATILAECSNQINDIVDFFDLASQKRRRAASENQ